MRGDRRVLTVLGVVAVVAFVLLMVYAITRDDTDLDGTSWVVESAVLEGDRVRPIDGTMITAEFVDGEVRGFGGCNSYFGGYTTDGSKFEVGVLASTEAFCDVPVGVSDQEFVYLSFLQSADGFDLDGDRLTLTLGGDDLLVFRSA